MKLREVLSGIPVVEAPTANPEVTGVAYDSRVVKPGDCFVAIPGAHTDGHRYVEVALRDGAAAALVQRRVGTAWPQVEVRDTRQALALAAANFYEQPTRSLQLVGVTGTDGKTTTSTMLHRILMSAGLPADHSRGAGDPGPACPDAR
jgi:UDP-N-acetylmuramoyl-L-alanyl-D-glutamate--2,6-diaminopimelate ligase